MEICGFLNNWNQQLFDLIFISKIWNYCFFGFEIFNQTKLNTPPTFVFCKASHKPNNFGTSNFIFLCFQKF